MMQSLPFLPQCWKSSFTFQALLFLIALSLLPMCARCSAMTLTVESAKTHYLLDEPLILTISLKNTSTQNVELPVILEPGVGFFTLFIREPGGQPKMYDCGVRGDISLPKHGKIFLPGEMVNTRMWLASNYDTKLSILSKPGTYTVFARYTLPKEMPGGPVALRSSDIQVQVNKPTGIEKNAHDLLLAGKNGCPWAYPSKEAEMQARMDRFARLLQLYPTCVYALHAQSEYASDLASFDLFDRDATQEDKVLYVTQSYKQYHTYMEIAKGTPLETDSLLKYGRACAMVNKVEQSAQALEAAFLSPTATTEERIEALSWTRSLESGGFREHLKEPGEKYPLPERTFPLLETARVLGFSVEWNKQTQTATISNPLLVAILPVGSNTIVVNGKTHTGALSIVNETGQVRISGRTIGYLLDLDWLTSPVI